LYYSNYYNYSRNSDPGNKKNKKSCIADNHPPHVSASSGRRREEGALWAERGQKASGKEYILEV
jgi:hypothetical protein